MMGLEVRKQILIEAPQAEAFRLFTEGIGEWWPLHTHSVHEDRAVRAVFEPRLGGRIYEISDGGQEAEWGRVLAWDPPRGFTTSWKPNPSAAAPTEFTVRFDALAERQTSIELVHGGWEALGDAAAEARGNYDEGWDEVLAAFTAVLAG